jgi:hypothetical protein
VPPPTLSEQHERRLDALEQQVELLRDTCRSLYYGVARYQPLPLTAPQHAALAAVLSADAQEEVA